MKKTLIIILIAIMSGIVMGFIFYQRFEINEVVFAKQDYSAKAVQVGVFSKLDNALSIKDLYDGIIVNDENLYRVYINIIKDQEVLSIMKEHYNELGINYYLKDIEISKEFNDILDDYEIILKNQDISNYSLTINSILKEYSKYEENVRIE